MKIRSHVFHAFISLFTSGLWLPVWWWKAGPNRPLFLNMIVGGLGVALVFFTVQAVFVSASDEYSFKRKIKKLSVAERTQYYLLSKEYPRISKHDMVEAVKLPESLRENYFQIRMAQFTEQAEQVAFKKLAANQSVRSSTADDIDKCVYMVTQTNARVSRSQAKETCQKRQARQLVVGSPRTNTPAIRPNATINREGDYSDLIQVYRSGIANSSTADFLATAATISLGCLGNRITGDICVAVAQTLQRAADSGVKFSK